MKKLALIFILLPTVLFGSERVDSIAAAQKRMAEGWQPTITIDSLSNPKLVEFLIMSGAKVDEVIFSPRTIIGNNIYQEKFTPLLYAVDKNNAALVKLLLMNKADPSIQKSIFTGPKKSPRGIRMTEKIGYNAYEIAAIRSNPEILKLFQELADAEKMRAAFIKKSVIEGTRKR